MSGYTQRVRMLLRFYVLTLGLSALLGAPILASWWGLLPASLPPTYLLFSNYGPALAAMVMVAATKGKPGVTDLLAALLRWRVGVQWYVVVLLSPVAVWAAALVLHGLLGGEVPDLLGPRPWGLLLIALALVAVHDAGEELGWRGYALPVLLARYEPLPASLMLAALWIGWHLPAWWLSGALAGGFPLPWWTLALVAYSILFTWVYRHSKGSVLLAVLFHAALNAVPGALPGLDPGAESWRPYALHALLMAALALAVALPDLRKERSALAGAHNLTPDH